MTKVTDEPEDFEEVFYAALRQFYIGLRPYKPFDMRVTQQLMGDGFRIELSLVLRPNKSANGKRQQPPLAFNLDIGTAPPPFPPPCQSREEETRLVRGKLAAEARAYEGIVGKLHP